MRVFFLSLLTAAGIAWFVTAVWTARFVRAFRRWQDQTNRNVRIGDLGSGMGVLVDFFGHSMDAGAAGVSRQSGKHAAGRALTWAAVCVLFLVLAIGAAAWA